MLQRRWRVRVMLVVGWPTLSVLANGRQVGHWVDVVGVHWLTVAAILVGWTLAGVTLSMAVWTAWRRLAPPTPTWRHIAALLGACIVAGVLFAAIDQGITGPMQGMLRRITRRTLANAPGTSAAIFAWVSVQILLDTYETLASERLRAAQAEARAAEARLDMLRNELNPHFLFNALNSIVGVIREDATGAQAMVRQLAALLRHTLYGPPVTTLGEELKVARHYLAIEQVRFEDRLQVEVSVPSDLLDLPTPPMVLQVLVENAIKHGAAETMQVSVRAQRVGQALVLDVTNRGTLTTAEGGVGLRNLRERLAPGGGTVALRQEDDTVVATVQLPMGTSS